MDSIYQSIHDLILTYIYGGDHGAALVDIFPNHQFCLCVLLGHIFSIVILLVPFFVVGYIFYFILRSLTGRF